MKGYGRKVIQVIEELGQQGFVSSKVLVDGFYGCDVCPLAKHHPSGVAGEDVE
jgi:hypothetical protein